jgi:hypothetical protein
MHCLSALLHPSSSSSYYSLTYTLRMLRTAFTNTGNKTLFTARASSRRSSATVLRQVSSLNRGGGATSLASAPTRNTVSSHSRFISTSTAINMSSSDNGNKRPRKDEENKNDQDDWKNQPPYVPENPDKPKKAHFTGTCHCKDVTFEIYVDKPKGSHFCQWVERLLFLTRSLL